MRSALLANATDISLWVVRRDAQDTMPQLLRRLVHATSRKILRSNFRAGEGVQFGGNRRRQAPGKLHLGLLLRLKANEGFLGFVAVARGQPP